MTGRTLRRQPWAAPALLLLTLIGVGALVAAIDAGTQPATASGAPSQTQVAKGSALFAEGCASCHGPAGEGTTDGPSLIGVGAASVDFQVTTGRMPLAAPNVQAMRKPPSYDREETLALAAYVAALGPGPTIPSGSVVDEWRDASVAKGGELFRVNCAQCHNFAGRGGALSDGRYAPSLMSSTPQEIYEAMLTGPQSMPVFADTSLPPESKAEIIAFIENLKQEPNPGGLDLGRFGPVTEGLFLWTAGMGALVAAAIWIGARVR